MKVSEMIKINGKYYPHIIEVADEETTISNEDKIAELKSLLAETDYKAIKYAEGWLTDEEYEPIKQQRQEWREEINRLEMGTQEKE